MIFPNPTELGLALTMVIKISKPIWIWFGICVLQNHFFLSKPNSNWFGKSYEFLGFNFSKPNWFWFWKGHWIKCSCTAHAHTKSAPRTLCTAQTLHCTIHSKASTREIFTLSKIWFNSCFFWVKIWVSVRSIKHIHGKFIPRPRTPAIVWKNDEIKSRTPSIVSRKI